MISKWHNEQIFCRKNSQHHSIPSLPLPTATKEETDRGRKDACGYEKFLGFLLVAFKLLARLMFQHKERTCFMLCANLMPPSLLRLLRILANLEGNNRENLNKYEWHNFVHFLTHDHPFKISLLKVQWALSCPLVSFRPVYMHNLHFNWNFISHENWWFSSKMALTNSLGIVWGSNWVFILNDGKLSGKKKFLLNISDELISQGLKIRVVRGAGERWGYRENEEY